MSEIGSEKIKAFLKAAGFMVTGSVPGLSETTNTAPDLEVLDELRGLEKRQRGVLIAVFDGDE